LSNERQSHESKEQQIANATVLYLRALLRHEVVTELKEQLQLYGVDPDQIALLFESVDISTSGEEK
jgi:hypothetical protein